MLGGVLQAGDGHQLDQNLLVFLGLSNGILVYNDFIVGVYGLLLFLDDVDPTEALLDGLPPILL